MTKWARILKDDTIVTKRAKGGQVRSELGFTKGTDTPIKADHLVILVERGSAEEIDPPANQGTDKKGRVVDRSTDTTLLGSSKLPAIVEVGAYKVQLGGIVVAAQAASDLTPNGWNDLPEADREERLAAMIERLTNEPDTVETIVGAPSIVEKPSKKKT